ncbi:MAG TPA: hypothetical protein DEF68_07675 [Elusimicrobia bacterium]|nr:hypothetical protein [Elusimicrobiota bacterium]
MESKVRGKNTSKVEVVSVSRDGIWLNAGGKEYVLPYAEFPWFRYAKPSQLKAIQFLHGHHLFWPKLDIDLDLDCISNPKNYPLEAKITRKQAAAHRHGR